MKYILYAFIILAAILQIIYIPLILLHVSFDVVFYISITIMIVSIICFAVFMYKFIKKRKIVHRKIGRKEIVVTALLITIIVVQAVTSCILFNENADDAFYVSLMEQNKDSKSIYMTEPSTGTENTNALSRYEVSGYELAVSVLSKLTTISVATLAHSIIPFFTIILSYMAYYQLARKFFNKEKSKTFILILSILFLFSGFTTRFRGIILLSRMWQGKEIFLNIVLTLILSNLISLNKYNQKRNLIALTILNFTAVFFSNTAIFLVPFAYMAFGIIELIKRNWKMFGKLLVTGIPIAIYAVIYLLCAKNARGVQFATLDFRDVIKDYFGTGYFYILYIISLVIIAIKGTKRAKKYFLAVPAIYILTIYNPLLTNIIIKYFIGSEVFWRLLWLLPVEISIVYAFLIILNVKKKVTYQISVFIVEIALLVVAGKFVYTKDNGFEIAENKYKIPQYIVNQTQYILDNTEKESTPTVIAPPEPLHNVTMRQLTSQIELIWSRNMYMNEICTGEELEERSCLYSIEESNLPQIDAEKYDLLIKKYSVNWIIVPQRQDIIDYLDKTNSKNKIEIDGYLLYQY